MPEIRNPNLQTQGTGGGGGGDMRSTMILWLVMLLAFFGYETFFNKPKPQPQPPAQSQQQSAQQANQSAASSQPLTAHAGNTQAAGGTQAAGAAPAVTADTQTATTVENELYKIVLTNRGGQVEHWILKKYKDSDGQPLDLVQQQTAERFGLPLGLFTYDAALDKELNGALYKVTVSGAQSASGSVLAPATVAFHYAANGLDAVKTLHFGSDYVVGVDSEVTRNGAPVRALVQWPAGLGDMEEFAPGRGHATAPAQRTSVASAVVWSVDGKQSTIVAKKVSHNATFTDPYSYAGVMDLYFAAAFMPVSPDQTTVVTLHNSIDLRGDPGDPNSKMTPADVVGIAVGSTTGATRLRLFAGPKATDVLASVHSVGADGKPDGSLSPLIQFGMWSIVAKPLYFVLRFLVEHGVANWGWAIILFTALFTLALLPTRISMTKSSLKMMRIQPKVDAIKARYKNLKATDPKRAEMNQEMMALYKTENVNMYGSCLPLLVQMPLFFAYYRVLQNSVELRQAHWLWLPDLSQPDPTHILPILIIVTMFLTQYITPSPGMDPAQRRMMAFMMPVVFGFMLWHYASGLALYWGTSNIIYLVMQIAINRSHWGKEMHAIAARRAAKKSGVAGAKTIQGRR